MIKMYIKTLVFSLLFVLTSGPSYGLVDYSDEVDSARNESPRSVRSKPNKSKIVRRQNKSRAASSSNNSGMFNLNLGYETISANAKDTEGGQVVSKGEGKVGIFNVGGHFRTPYDLYLDFNYWRASTDKEAFSANDGSQGGNPLVLVGFNWLKFGQGQDTAGVDLYAGASFSSSSSLASSRTDKIFGVETSKRFYVFALSLGYEYRLTGSPGKVDELGVGNIQKIKATAGWMVSGDIQLALEGGTVKIGESSEEDRVSKLTNKLTFGYLRPSLFLGLAPSVTLEMGGTFRTDKMRTDEVATDTKLWDQPGAYGNSLFADLHVSI
jgi:hypothetical protein